MARLALQHHILQDPVAVAVQGGGFLFPCLQHDLALEDPGPVRLGAHVIGLVPAVQVLFHRLAVEEDNGHPGGLGLVHDHRRGGPVHQVDTDHVIVLLQETVHLLVLGGLAAAGVSDVEIQLDAQCLLPDAGLLLQVLHHGGEKGVLLEVQGHTYPDGRCLLDTTAAAQAQNQGRQGQQRRRPSHPSPHMGLLSTSAGHREQ